MKLILKIDDVCFNETLVETNFAIFKKELEFILNLNDLFNQDLINGVDVNGTYLGNTIFNLYQDSVIEAGYEIKRVSFIYLGQLKIRLLCVNHETDESEEFDFDIKIEM